MKPTIAGSSGLLWLILVVHFTAGLIALSSGVVALCVTKGGTLHKRSGMGFTWSMIALGLLAAVIAAHEGQISWGGLLTAYLVFTGATTVKLIRGGSRALDMALMVFAFAAAGMMYWGGLIAWAQPRHMLNGVPAGMIFFLATIALLAAIGDLRLLRAGAITGPRRLARHLWRMCFGLFIATGSFFIGQMKFIPEPVRYMPLLMALGIAPLPVLIYWMWRVRVRKALTGILIGGPLST